jgi:predicted transcriptional regulator
MKTVSTTVDEDILARLDKLAGGSQSGSRSRSSMIRDALRAHVARMERKIEHERETKVFRRHRKRLDKEVAALLRDQFET